MTRVTIWGSRGSLASPGEAFTGYGGNTSCVEVTGSDGTSLIFDAGTGLLGLGRSIKPLQREFYLFLTHLHMDHIQGMGFFSPFFNRKCEVNVWGPASTTNSLKERLIRYLSPPLFPVSLRDLPCKLSLNQVPCADISIGPFRVISELVGHVGPTVGYRIEAPDAVITYIPDHEPALGVENFPIDEQWTSGYTLAENADLMIHDAQYSESEYLNCVGWGHSSILDTFKFAKLAGVKHLVPFHHDPMHSDESIDDLIKDAIETVNPGFKVTPGKEGLVMEL
jgi:phosphoribosyl 1,2-cyclic phosphodiesterase